MSNDENRWLLVKCRDHGNYDATLSAEESAIYADHLRKADHVWINQTRTAMRFKIPDRPTFELSVRN